ncbi:SDHD, membrane anchor subunit of succinate dehydrogenase [Hymenopellis radicata]|nr:SDHD, membrane anchor subunit of succinate dehydrogenase [Hymenopellis radicata]
MSSSLIVRSTLPRSLAHRAARTLLFLKIPVAVRYASEVTYVPGGRNRQRPHYLPHTSKSHGSYHWAFERLLSAGLVPLTAATFVTSGTNYPILDGILGVSLIMHSHIGFDAVFTDYVHPRKFPVLGPTVSWGLRAATVGVLVGVYQFNTNDIGLTELITKVWSA